MASVTLDCVTIFAAQVDYILLLVAAAHQLSSCYVSVCCRHSCSHVTGRLRDRADAGPLWFEFWGGSSNSGRGRHPALAACVSGQAGIHVECPRLQCRPQAQAQAAHRALWGLLAGSVLVTAPGAHSRLPWPRATPSWRGASPGAAADGAVGDA